MAGSRFDSLLRALATTPSRRGALRLLTGSAIGGLLVTGGGPSAAKKKKKVTLCHSGQTISVSKKKKKTHLKHGDTLGACAAKPLPPPPDATCSDGIQNGSETGVDCGGPTCPRCSEGQGCAQRADCASFVCSGGTCAACGPAGTPCGADPGRACSCKEPVDGGPSICGAGVAVAGPIFNCNGCPENTICTFSGPAGLYCFSPCEVKYRDGWFCDVDAQCASGQCGCTGTGPDRRCFCRRVTCSGIGGPCEPGGSSTPEIRDIDCCEGSCTGTGVSTDENFCT